MGCYGIGVTRVVAAAIEQNFDENGIKWPQAIAPFELSLIPINMKKSQKVQENCERIYNELKNSGIDVFFDDRELRAGLMFKDHELIGIPHRIVISDRGLEEGNFEYKGRTDSDAQQLPLTNLLNYIKDKINIE